MHQIWHSWDRSIVQVPRLGFSSCFERSGNVAGPRNENTKFRTIFVSERIFSPFGDAIKWRDPTLTYIIWSNNHGNILFSDYENASESTRQKQSDEYILTCFSIEHQFSRMLDINMWRQVRANGNQVETDFQQFIASQSSLIMTK